MDILFVKKSNSIIFMYNGHIINELLIKQKKQAKDLLNYLQINTNGSLTQIVKGNPSASRLEKIADFFCVSTDTFFTREIPITDINSSGNISSAQLVHLDSKVKNLQSLIEEKDKRIALLEDMIDVLKAQNK